MHSLGQRPVLSVESDKKARIRSICIGMECCPSLFARSQDQPTNSRHTIRPLQEAVRLLTEAYKYPPAVISTGPSIVQR